VGGLLGAAIAPPAAPGASLRLSFMAGAGYHLAPRPGWSLELRLVLIG